MSGEGNSGRTGSTAGLVRGTLILPDGLLPQGAVAFRDGRIAWVGREAELPAEWRGEAAEQAGQAGRAERAGRAEYVAPGLVDVHLHGSGGYDVMSGDPEHLAGLSRFLAERGTTAFLATTLSAPPEVLEQVARAAGASWTAHPSASALATAGAELLGLHLEGPYLNPAKAGAHAPATLRPLDREEVARLQRLSGGSVRLITLAPELARAEDLRDLRTQGIRLSAGHSQATCAEAQEAFRAGVDEGTHLFNAMPPLGHREPGLAGAVLATDGVFAQLILDFVHVHPAVAKVAIRAKGPGQVLLVTDALSLTGLPSGRYQWDGRPVEVRPDAIYLVDGPLAGSNLTLLEAVHHAVDLGFTLPEAWRMASLTPARALGLEGRKGNLTPGTDADLLLLGGDLSLQGVYCRGRRAA